LAELQLLDIKTVCALVGLKPTAIYEREAAGTFPAAIRQGTRCTRWTAGSIRAWIQGQIEAQTSPQQQRAHQQRRAIATRAAAKAQDQRRKAAAQATA
jgi:predicted DNA-binding transcriptional regulator AlpA